MKKNLPKILIIVFVSIFVLQLIGLIALFTLPQSASANTATFHPQVDPGGIAGQGVDNRGTLVCRYIASVYRWGIGFVSTLATVVMMIGGIVWITAAGNASRISEAKAWIGAALTGLVLALFSYMILDTINPRLVNCGGFSQPVTSAPVTSTSGGSAAISEDGDDVRVPVSDCYGRPRSYPCVDLDAGTSGYCDGSGSCVDGSSIYW